MFLYLKKEKQNFKTIFLEIICMILKVTENNLLEIIYIDENCDNKLLGNLPIYTPKNQKKKSIQRDELEIAKEISKSININSLNKLSDSSNNLIIRSININKYDIHKILPELNEYLNSIKFSDKNYKISIFDIFYFSLISINMDIILDDIQFKFKNILVWLKYLLNLVEISQVCNKLEIYKKFEKNQHNLSKELIINDKSDKKYYILYNKKNGEDSIGNFNEFNGRQIYNKSKNNDFIDGKIYYFFSNEDDNSLIITNQTKIYYYIYENKICLEQNIPFSFFGKIMEKNGNIFVILSNNYEQVIFLDDKEKIMQKTKINTFNYFLCMKIASYDDNSIFLETTKISKIKYIKPNSIYDQSEIDAINKRILIKYNFIDFKDINHYNYIKLYNSQYSISVEINNETIYFAFKEDEISQEYFPENIELLRNSNDSNVSKYRVLLYKGFCNEINVFINEIHGGFAYEYYYISKKTEFLPKTIKIKLNNSVFNSEMFWKYDTSKRQKITFINIPKQDISLESFEYNSFLKIISCISSNELIDYGIFLLDNLKINAPKIVKIDSSFESLIKDIQDDIKLYQEGKKTSKYLEDKYLGDKKEKYINIFSYDYRGYYFPDKVEYFNYFNNMCIWMLLANSNSNDEETKFTFQIYFEKMQLIQNKKNMNYEDKIILLITLIRRALDSKNSKIIIPEVIFFDDLDKINYCYKKAYDFHLDLIDSLTENSKLIQPFLQLNSYIMEMLLTEDDKIKIKSAKINKINQSDLKKEILDKLIENLEKEKLITESAYTISMIPLDVIKKHLKNTMKPYAIIWKQGNKENFAASVYKDNNIICFNEEEIFKGVYIGYFNNSSFRSKKENDFAFILNMYFLHENSSHNKEKVINLKEDSPFIFMDENLISSLIFCDENCESGEAGCFTECFIAERLVILDLVNCNYNFGDLLNVKYFNQESFDNLINIYNTRKLCENKNKIKEKNSYTSSFILDKNKNNETYDNEKRDIFGFSQRDNNLFKEAKQRHCYY